MTEGRGKAAVLFKGSRQTEKTKLIFRKDREGNTVEGEGDSVGEKDDH